MAKWWQLIVPLWQAVLVSEQIFACAFEGKMFPFAWLLQWTLQRSVRHPYVILLYYPGCVISHLPWWNRWWYPKLGWILKSYRFFFSPIQKALTWNASSKSSTRFVLWDNKFEWESDAIVVYFWFLYDVATEILRGTTLALPSRIILGYCYRCLPK